MEIKALLSCLHNPEIIGTLPDHIQGITADSRKVKQGWAYIAVKGLTHDGHDFIVDAESSGASVIVSERASETNLPVVKVSDTREAWGPAALAMAGNPQNNLNLVGVTGTNGKTTITTLVHQALDSLGYNAGLMGTIEVKIGDKKLESRLTTADPETIASHLKLMKEAGCDSVIMEVSSHALDQKRTNGLDFKVGVFSNLSHDHLDYHGTVESYLKAKKLLFDNLSESSTAIVNTDDTSFSSMISDCKADVWGFGLKDGSVNIVSQSTDGMLIEIDGISVQTPLAGIFNAYNVSAAFLVCRALGISAGNASAALAEAKGAKGRLERISEDSNEPVVFVDYAHTPDALENVLKTLSEIEGRGKIITVFGCGGDRDKKKRPVMGKTASVYSDVIWVTSDNPRTENPDAIISDILVGISHKRVYTEPERKKAIHNAISEAEEKDIVLIAGKGHETYQEINGVRYPLDDSKEARKALAARRTSPHFKEKEGC